MLTAVAIEPPEIIETQDGEEVGTEGRLWLVDKPLGWTSFDVVAKLRNALTKRTGVKQKVGHAGTLDPQATGLLLIATGKMTKQLSQLEVLDKEYTGTLRLGARTKSFDSETEEYGMKDVSHLTDEMLFETAKSFLGTQLQLPPMFSAVWHKGQRLYDLARKGTVVEGRTPREITIFEFELTGIRLPEVGFQMRVSKGTYIRSVANDFGERLDVGAYLKSLRRTKVGKYDVAKAMSLPDALAEITK
ncbi:MAG: tRNA pseudouridine(55) synthase TruB [Rhizobacter sp.]|nr:tRNA pseudouridine(55) synthase TruB [Chlorobiales bacterium]